MQTRSLTVANRSVGEWLSSLPTVIILLLTIFLASGEIIHSQLLKIGENTWQGYFELRTAGLVREPSCNPDPDVEGELRRAILEKEASMADDPLASIFGSDIDEDAMRRSLNSSREICRERWESYERVKERVTPGVIMYRNLETGVAAVVTTLGNYKRLLLCILVLICAATTTLQRHHIALRPSRTVKDHYIGTSAQLVANLMLLMSATVYRGQEQISMSEGVQVHDFYLHIFWIAGFALLSAINFKQLISPPKDLEPGGGWGKAFLTIPLYSLMCLTAGAQFMSQGYYHGISVYLGMMMELSTLFLNLALYIWIGMMLKQTRMAQLAFDVLRPWNMSPELMCFVVLALAAFPTAFTGASGIFIIAAGAVIYTELMRAGARKQLALAATAMSGSMGVVLRPCLLVVIIAALNRSVTTNELFASGFKVYVLSIVLFFIVSQFFRTEPARIAPFSEAVPKSIRALAPLAPYAIMIVSVAIFFREVLNRGTDEFSAPIILPVMLIAVLLYEKLSKNIVHVASAVLIALVGWSFWKMGDMEGSIAGTVFRNLLIIGIVVSNYVFSTTPLSKPDDNPNQPAVGKKLESSLRLATNETTGHIGALLMLMALSVSTGGIIERSGLMEQLPETFANIWVATTILVITMVVIGMIMDPYGAVILVNATIAQVAFANGIDPLHFWMITLVSFELGYLTPPVALNHLLARQVIGDDEVESSKIAKGQASFVRRYEKFILPILVMLSALLIVSYLPLMSEGLHSWMFQKAAGGAL
ncbi:MAG: C4-dicarboxylate ABC transporter [Gammaproteobacteria bacterium HGW-Gammaproteobacteria-14]|nr:MAG: C4-dicarboxylate ABC transporter [Gammaproteobacteria bacterium HGW-Gammaproteobacteria-14]